MPTGGTLSKADWGLDNYQLGDALWLGDACNLAEWENYFSELVDNPDPGDELAWFALNFNGSSIASGLNETPKLLELLGQQLQPMEILDKTDDVELLDGCNKLIAKQVLDKQRQFYRILTDSDVESEMQSIYSTMPSPEVDEVCFL